MVGAGSFTTFKWTVYFRTFESVNLEFSCKAEKWLEITCTGPHILISGLEEDNGVSSLL